jgi:hypothetical protein
MPLIRPDFRCIEIVSTTKIPPYMIDWCLTATLEVFQLYRCEKNDY